MSIFNQSPEYLKHLIEKDQRRKELLPYHDDIVRMQDYVKDTGSRIYVPTEGRDTAGKGRCIRKINTYLNPRYSKIVALDKPTPEELAQLYYERYDERMPLEGEIVWGDRSGHNRSVVEPVNEYCSEQEYHDHMYDVVDFERYLVEDRKIDLIKIYLSVQKDTQYGRFLQRQKHYRTHWKYSKNDEKAQALWGYYSRAKLYMLERTHTDFAPWHIIESDDKFLSEKEYFKTVVRNVLPESERNPNIDYSPDPAIFRMGDEEARIMRETGKIGKPFYESVCEPGEIYVPPKI